VGVPLTLFSTQGEAPDSTNSFTTSTLPESAAMWIGAQQFYQKKDTHFNQLFFFKYHTKPIIFMKYFFRKSARNKKKYISEYRLTMATLKKATWTIKNRGLNSDTF
jgi:hypothetical protein